MIPSLKSLIGAGLAIALASCSAEEIAALNAQLAAAGASGANASTAVTTVSSTTQTINTTVQTVQTVTDLASSVSSLSDTGDSLSTSSTSGSATSSDSVLGGVRGSAPRRQTTTTQPPPPPPPGTTTTTQPLPPPGAPAPVPVTAPNFDRCVAPPPPAAGTTATVTPPPLPCFCVYKSPENFTLDKETTCNENLPGSPTPVTAKVTLSKTEEGDGFKIKMTASLPTDAKLPQEVKDACTESSGKLECTREFILAKICKADDATKCLYVPPPPAPQGANVFVDKRLKSPKEMNAPADFSDQTAVKNWMLGLLSNVDAAGSGEDKAKLKDKIGLFLVTEKGWVTDVQLIKCEPGNEKQKPAEIGLCPPPPPKAEAGGPAGPRPTKEVGVRFFSHQVPPPVFPGEKPPTTAPKLQAVSGEVRAIDIAGKTPDGKEIKDKIFRVQFEAPGQGECTPKDLKGAALANVKGNLVKTVHAEISEKGGFGQGSGEGCRAQDAPTTPEAGKAPTPPTSYLSEEKKSLRKLPEPPADKRPPRYPTQEEALEKVYMTIKPPELRGKAGELGTLPPPPPGQGGPGGPGGAAGPGGPGTPPPPPPPPPSGILPPPPGPGTPPPPPPAVVASVPKLQDRPGGPGPGLPGPGTPAGPGGPGVAAGGPGGAPGQMSKCPGTGGGQRDVTITFNDGKTEKQSQVFVKKEGECRPTPCDPSVTTECRPLTITEDAKGNITTRVKDAKGQEVEATIENPDSENKTVKISAGFVTGSITYHAADDKGIIAEGELKVNALGTQVEVVIQLSAAGWQHVRGKVGTSDGKTVVFWQDRTAFDGADGATIQFAVVAGAASGVTVSATATSPTGTEAAGTVNMGVPGTTTKDDCENSGNGALKILTGSESNTELTLTLFEDESSIVKTKDGTIANEPLTGCAAKNAGTGKTTSASTTGQTQSSGQATTTGGTKATAYTY